MCVYVCVHVHVRVHVCHIKAYMPSHRDFIYMYIQSCLGGLASRVVYAAESIQI